MPRTIVSVRGWIQGFGQNGDWIVWADVGSERDAPCHRQVVMRRVSGGRTTSLVSRRGATCQRGWPGESGQYQGRMALAGTRALWVNVLPGIQGTTHYIPISSSLRSRHDRERAMFTFFRGEDTPPRPLPLAGDDATLVYANWSSDTTADQFGYVLKVESRLRRIPGTSRTLALALSGRFLARAFSGLSGEANGVEVRNVHTGVLLTRFFLTGRPLAVGLSRSRLAVLVEDASGKRRIEIRRNATFERSVPVASAAEDLSMSGRWVAYRTGRVIRALDVRSGQAHRLGVTPSARVDYSPNLPVGLSIEGRRVAWAERISMTRSRIRTITLPR
jgi:hypothetical protein